MNDMSSDLSVLTLEYEVVDGRTDWPLVGIRVDGENPFAEVAKGWRGFDPAEILGLLIPDEGGGRLAVNQCSCAVSGCGVIAPLVVASPDRKRISWVDFRDYVGVFAGPVEPRAANHEGRPWGLPDIHFDYDQYVTEVRRALNDRSWETPRRQTARHLKQRLTDHALPMVLRWVSPAWDKEGYVLSFEHDTRGQQLYQLTSPWTDPARAAEDMAERMLAAAPDEWERLFGYSAQRHVTED